MNNSTNNTNNEVTNESSGKSLTQEEISCIIYNIMFHDCIWRDDSWTK